MHSKCHFINMHRGGGGAGIASEAMLSPACYGQIFAISFSARVGWGSGGGDVKNLSDAFVESASLQVFLIQPSAKRLGYIKCSAPTINVRVKHSENTEPVMRTDFFFSPTRSTF